MQPLEGTRAFRRGLEGNSCSNASLPHFEHLTVTLSPRARCLSSFSLIITLFEVEVLLTTLLLIRASKRIPIIGVPMVASKVIVLVAKLYFVWVVSANGVCLTAKFPHVMLVEMKRLNPAYTRQLG